MLRDVQEIQALATKYSKAQLAHMAQVGMIDPTKAVMAGMMIDRIAKQNMQPPQTTVAQDVLQAPAPMQMPQQMPQQPQSPGVAALPSNVGNYALGGIVAFAGEDESLVTDPYADEVAALDASQVLTPGRGRGAPPKGGMPEKTRKFLERKEEIKPSYGRTRAGQIIDDRRTVTAAPLPIIPASEISGYMAANKGLSSLLNRPVAPVDTTVNQLAAPPAVVAPPPVVAQRASSVAPVIKEPAAPATPAAPPLPPIDTNIPVELTKKPEPTTAIAEQQKREQHYREMGINPDMYKELIAGQEEKRKKLPSKDEALGHALMQAGFGLMGARRGQEWQTLGKEAQGALTSYQTALKDIRASEDKIDEAKQALVLAENQYKKTGADVDLAKVEARQEKIDALTAQDVKAKNEAAVKSKELATHIYGYNRTSAAQELASERHLIGVKYTANAHLAASQFAQNAPPAQLKQVEAILADLRTRDPNATYVQAYNIFAGQGKSGVLSDEDLYKDWAKNFAKSKELTASKAEKEFAKNYPTWQSYANSQRGGVAVPPTPNTGGWGKMSVSGQ